MALKSVRRKKFLIRQVKTMFWLETPVLAINAIFWYGICLIYLRIL